MIEILVDTIAPVLIIAGFIIWFIIAIIYLNKEAS